MGTATTHRRFDNMAGLVGRTSFVAFAMLLVVFPGLCPIVWSQDTDARIDRISAWGKNVQEALDRGSIATLKINASTHKKGPERVVSVQQFHTNSSEILHILKPAAAILEHEFTVIDQHNLAVTMVSFEFELPQVCHGTADRFVMSSTGSSMFYIGCSAMDSSGVRHPALLRIRSASLYAALHSHFPREILK